MSDCHAHTDRLKSWHGYLWVSHDVTVVATAAQQVIDQFDIPAVAQLFEETDFVGMSSYPSLSPRFTPDQLENALWQFAREIKYFGVNLEKVRQRDRAGFLVTHQAS